MVPILQKIGSPSKSFGNNVSIDAEESVLRSGKKRSLHSIHIPAVAINKNTADKKSRRSSRLNHRIVAFSLENFKGGKLPLNRAILQKYLFERENNPTKETRLIANHLLSEIVENIWLPARIPKKHNKKDYADQIVRLVIEYKTLKKIPESRR